MCRHSDEAAGEIAVGMCGEKAGGKNPRIRNHSFHGKQGKALSLHNDH